MSYASPRTPLVEVEDLRVWFPITSGVMQKLAQALPSYWLVQASHVGLGGNGWGTRGWVVDGLWTAALAALAVRAYRRDTGRA